MADPDIIDRVLSPSQITPYPVSMTATSLNLRGVSTYKCCNKNCAYQVSCTFLNSTNQYRLLTSSPYHSCTSVPTTRIQQQKPSKKRLNQYSLIPSAAFDCNSVRRKFSPSQLSYLHQWCTLHSWSPKQCQIPSQHQLVLLQQDIGPSPDLSRWFVSEIRKLIGTTIRLFAWHFDVTGERQRWSRMVFGDEWDIAYCHGKIIGVEIGTGFVTKMHTYRNTPSWESVLSPDIIDWINDIEWCYIQYFCSSVFFLYFLFTMLFLIQTNISRLLWKLNTLKFWTIRFCFISSDPFYWNLFAVMITKKINSQNRKHNVDWSNFRFNGRRSKFNKNPWKEYKIIDHNPLLYRWHRPYSLVRATKWFSLLVVPWGHKRKTRWGQINRVTLQWDKLYR